MGKITMDEEDFATLAICAIRYCHGRRTYMPSKIQGIIRGHLTELSDHALYVMLNDCEWMNEYDYGDPLIDKPGWLQWRKEFEDEKRRRENG